MNENKEEDNRVYRLTSKAWVKIAKRFMQQLKFNYTSIRESTLKYSSKMAVLGCQQEV